MNNMLCDPASKQITALFDLDFSLITHPFHEFCSSFHDVGGNVRRKPLSAAVISGEFDGAAPEGVDEEQWALARAFDAALAKTDILKPSHIKGLEGLLRLSALQGMLCPFQFHTGELAQLNEQEKIEKRARAEAVLTEFLTSYGY
jgi:hypothetical protein